MNKKQILYLILCVAATILPYSQFIPFLREHGLDIPLFFQQLFANKVSGFFGMDVIVASVALWVFVYSEGARLKMRHLWVYVVANLAVGVCLGLTLFLLMRESKLDKSAMAATR
jgi:flagellar biosynthesis protein FliR